MFDDLPWSATLIFTVIALLILWWLIAWLIKRNDPIEREKRIIRRLRNNRRWARTLLRSTHQRDCFRDVKGVQK